MKKTLLLVSMIMLVGTADAQGLKGLLSKAKKGLEKATTVVDNVVDKVQEEVTTFIGKEPQEKADSAGVTANKTTSATKTVPPETKEVRTTQTVSSQTKEVPATANTREAVDAMPSQVATNANMPMKVSTRVKGMGTSALGYTINTDVSLSLQGVDKSNCVCFVMMTNSRWKDELSLKEFSQLSTSVCHNFFELKDSVKGNAGTFSVSVPLKSTGLLGKDSLLYIRSYILDTQALKFVGMSDLVSFHPEKPLPLPKSLTPQEEAALAGLIMEGFNNYINTKEVDDGKCPLCKGAPTCMGCYARSSEEKAECSHCHGSGHCPTFKY